MQKAGKNPINSTMQSAKKSFPGTGIGSAEGNKSMVEKSHPGTKPSAVDVKSNYVTNDLSNPVKR